MSWDGGSDSVDVSWDGRSDWVSWDGGSDCVSRDRGLNSVSRVVRLDDVSGSDGWDALRVCLDPLCCCHVNKCYY